MAQANPFDQFDSAQPAQPAPRPQSPPPFIQGTISPTKQAAETRAQQDQALQMERFRLDQEKAARDAEKDQRTAQKDASGTVDEKKIATLTTRLAGAFSDMAPIIENDPSAAEPGIIESVRGGLSNDGITAIPARAIAGANRRSVYDAEIDALDALLTLGTGAAYNREQLDGQRIAYFPAYGDTAEERALKKNRLARLIEAAKVNAGPAWQQVEPQIAQFMQTQEDRPDPIATTFGGDGSKPNPGNNPDGYVEIDPVTGEETVVGWTQEQKDRYNRLIEMNANYGRATGNLGTDGRFDAGNAYGQRFKEGIMVGLGDEISGVGGFIGAGIRGENPMQGYLDARDAARIRQMQMRDQQGALGYAAEIGGNLVPAMLMPGATAGTVRGAATSGAAFGGLSGFGEGRGFEGSATNALVGSVIGGVTGAAVQGGLNRLARPGSASSAIPNADEVIRAGEQFNIPVMTSDVVPPKTAVGRTMRTVGESIPLAGTGGKRAAQDEARQVAVENFVKEFGDGDAMSAVYDVSADFVKKRSGEIARLSTAKDSVIDGLQGPVPAPQAVAEIDRQIARLNAANPDAFAPVVAKLENFKQVLSSGKSLREVEMNRKLLGDLFQDPNLAAIKGDGQKALNAIYGPLRDDMGAFIKATGGDAAFNKWSMANKKLADLAGEMDASAFKRFMNKAETEPEEASKILFSKKPSDMNRLYNNLSDAGKIKARAAIIFKAAEGATTDGVISPTVFANKLADLDQSMGVFFSPADKARIDGLQRLLVATKQAVNANAMPMTGASNRVMIGGIGGAQMLGGATLPVSGFAGLMARAYESKTVRNMLVALGRTKPGSPGEANLANRILSAIRTNATALNPANDGIVNRVANAPSATAAAAKDDEQN